MSSIDRVGTFRGKVIDRGISETTNGFPQAVLQLQAMQLWDEENKVWQDWNYDEVEAIAYLTLFGRNDKATLSMRQVMKAFGWDGVSFMDFQESDKLSDSIQFRVEENTYEGNTTLRVNWIDSYDAEPGKKLQKLDKSGVAKLQAKYAGALVNLSGGPKPKSAPPSAPKPAAKTKEEPEADAEPATTPEAVVPGGDQTPAPPEPTTPPPAPAAPAPPKTKAKAKKTKPVDMNAAWQKVYDAGTKAGKTQVEITQMWTDIVKEAGGPDEIGEDWTDVESGVLALIG